MSPVDCFVLMQLIFGSIRILLFWFWMSTSLYSINDTATISPRLTLYCLELKHWAQIQILHQGAYPYDEKQSFRLYNMQQPIDHRILRSVWFIYDTVYLGEIQSKNGKILKKLKNFQNIPTLFRLWIMFSGDIHLAFDTC